MGSFQILDLVVGVIFIYFLLSIICSSIIEMANNLSKVRAKMLEQWITDNFNHENSQLGSHLLDTASIDGLTLKGRKPSYLPSNVFVRALFDQVVKDYQEKNNIDSKPYGIDELKKAIEETKLLRSGIKRMILQNMKDASDNLEKTRKGLEDWFDSAMERLGGTFKKRSQIRLFIIGLVVSMVLNVDTVVLVKYFYQNPKVARQIADAAQESVNDASNQAKYSKQNQVVTNDSSAVEATQLVANIMQEAVVIDSLQKLLSSTNMPMGWQKDTKQCWIVPDSPGTWVSKFFGILISGFALSMGSVFWFDLLNKLVNLRGVGSKPASAPAVEEAVEKKKDS